MRVCEGIYSRLLLWLQRKEKHRLRNEGKPEWPFRRNPMPSYHTVGFRNASVREKKTRKARSRHRPRTRRSLPCHGLILCSLAHRGSLGRRSVSVARVQPTPTLTFADCNRFQPCQGQLHPSSSFIPSSPVKSSNSPFPRREAANGGLNHPTELSVPHIPFLFCPSAQ